MPVEGLYFTARYALGALSVEPLTPLIGACVSGIELGAPLADADRASIREALRRHKVLFFRGQTLPLAALVAFARRCGTLQIYTEGDAAASAHPEVKVFDYGPEQRGREAFWHFDVLPNRRPARAAILRARAVPEVGGDTLFCDLTAVYDSLSPAVRARLDPAVGLYDLVFERQLARFRGQPESEVMAIRPDIPLEPLPLVITPHGDLAGAGTGTGDDAGVGSGVSGSASGSAGAARKALFVNPSFLVRIDGWNADESRAQLAELREKIARPDFQCRFRWQAGDIALWDNHACLHYATSNYWPRRRTMERLTLLDFADSAADTAAADTGNAAPAYASEPAFRGASSA